MNRLRCLLASVLGLGAIGAAPSAGQIALPMPAKDLPQLFRDPPAEARPWTYWFWINGNISRQSITADLKAMARVGIKGVLIMEVSATDMAPAGPVGFAGKEWRQLFSHVISEAKRLGLEVNMNNDAGWTGSGGPWIQPEFSMQTLVSNRISVTGPQRLKTTLARPEVKNDFYRDVALLAYPETSENNADRTVRRAEVQDLTKQMDGNGDLSWDVPPGRWTVVRIGHTSTWVTNKPAPISGKGLECDKFNPDAIRRHLDAFIGQLVRDTKSSGPGTFTMSHIDSWEVGGQNWTQRMPQEFRSRCGYDLLPWLTSLTGGPALESAEQTARFLWDFNRTKCELVAENYAGAAREALHKYGLKLSIEHYGGRDRTIINPLIYGAEADVPMGEFWVERGDAWHLLSCRAAASIAHAFGRPIVGSESFTALATNDPWSQYPGSLKALADWAFAEGVNRHVFHRTVLNPWANDKAPGMTFAGFGTHFDRTQTWWAQGRAFMQYLTRCQYLLQQGRFVADVCRLVPDSQYSGVPEWNNLPAQYVPLPTGCNFDFVSDKLVLESMSVKDGRLVTAAGMSYALMQLPESKVMTPELLRKIRDLVRAGAVIIGPRPERSPSLRNYPQCDEEVRALAQETWGDNDGQTVHEHKLGKGRVIHGVALKNVLADVCQGVDLAYILNPPPESETLRPPAFVQLPEKKTVRSDHMPTAGLNWIHRRIGADEFYFLANPQYRPVDALCTFRVTGKRPEFWDPATGEITETLLFTSDRGHTTVPIHFDPAGSCFVVFRKPVSSADQVVAVERDGKTIFGRDQRTPGRLPKVVSTPSGPVISDAPPGRYTLVDDAGHSRTAEIAAPPMAQVLAEPWTVAFATGRGGPVEPVVFSQLADWAKHPDERIRHFSGTAVYKTEFDFEPAKGTRQALDLGSVQVIAEVKLNGKILGVLWKPPFQVDVTRVLRAGKNQLEISVANLWVNRLIGDEQYPDDCTPDSSWKKGPIKAWPEWVRQGQPRPEPRRVTFTTYKYYTKGDALLPSGLLGPVVIRNLTSVAANSR